jgi:hypothetical protein
MVEVMNDYRHTQLRVINTRIDRALDSGDRRSFFYACEQRQRILRHLRLNPPTPALEGTP